MLDVQMQDLTVQRHAYQTAPYQVSKREMAALRKRYDVWSADKKKFMQSHTSSGLSLKPLPSGVRHAYHSRETTRSLVSDTHRKNHVPRRAYQALYVPFSFPAHLSKLDFQLQTAYGGIHVTVS